MPRDLPIGNGNVLVAFDRDYQLRELYFPHVGEENHTLGKPFRLGLWVDGKFNWLPSGWNIKRDYLDDSLVTQVELTNESQKIRILANDLIDFHENIYLKKLEIENLSDEKREIRLFFTHDFYIYGNPIGDTAAFRPEVKGLLHYKKERYFLINVFANNKVGIDHFAAGKKGYSPNEGTWRDAEDGLLSGNPIEQGAVDSVISISLSLPPKSKESCFYWIAMGKNWEEVKNLNEIVEKKKPETIFKRTFDYWKLWVKKENLNLDSLPKKVARLYNRSLLICRTQINNCGSIISGNDSDVILFNRDTYSYLWPRDGALTAYALDLAGYFDITRQFFHFCKEIIEPQGYFLHKYNPSGSLASSWHPWQKNNKYQLPIQEDETALVIWALWHHYQKNKDVEFIKPLYKPLIKRAADFMMNYRDLNTGLPLPSYNLWEEKEGVLTFTTSAVYGGLMAAANFTEAFGETTLSEEYRNGARLIREGMDRYLYLEKEKRFAEMIQFSKEGKIETDATLDASLFGLFAFGAYPANDERVKSTMEQIREKLGCKTPLGGLTRYENDSYYRVNNESGSNPWFITTLWLAQYYIAIAKTREELGKALSILEWTADHALDSGVLAEQLHPTTQEPLSVSPLTWSHATFIIVIHEYLNRLAQIEKR